jgi:hypothetical protein
MSGATADGAIVLSIIALLLAIIAIIVACVWKGKNGKDGCDGANGNNGRNGTNAPLADDIWMTRDAPTGQVFTDGVDTVVLFPTQTAGSGVGGNIVYNNGDWIVPKAGVYSCTFNGMWGVSEASVDRVAIEVVGSTTIYFGYLEIRRAGPDAILQTSANINCVAGDVIRFRVQSFAGSNQTLQEGLGSVVFMSP